MKSFTEYEALAEVAHGHMCAGQILGLRMAFFGLRLLGIDDPVGRDRKRLISIVEIDRCATDAISVVTGCRLGKRALKFHDFGKVAAAFVDLESDRAVRVVALESSRERADEMHPEIAERKARQMQAYREMSDEELFSYQWIRVRLGPEDLPGYKGPRVECAVCAEAVKFRREIVRDGVVLCRSCAGERYWEPM